MFQFKSREGKESVFLVPQVTNYFFLIPFAINIHTRIPNSNFPIQDNFFLKLSGWGRRRGLLKCTLLSSSHKRQQFFLHITQWQQLLLVHAYRGNKPNHRKTECLIFLLSSMILKKNSNEVSICWSARE